MSGKTRRGFLGLLAATTAGCSQKKQTETSNSKTAEETDTTTSTPSTTATTEQPLPEVFKLDLETDKKPPITAYRKPETDKQKTVNVELSKASNWHFETYNFFKNRIDNLSDFVENIDNKKWLQEFEEELEDKYDTELNHEFTWKNFETTEDYQDKVTETGFNTLWYRFEQDRLGGISSSHNRIKAAAWQEIWSEKLESDTFIFPIQLGNHHGNGVAIANPANFKENYGSEELYRQALEEQTTHVMEMGQQAGSHFNNQASEIKEADYLEPETWEFNQYWHPALFGEETDHNLPYSQRKDLVQLAFLGMAGIKPRGGSFSDKHTIDHGFAREFSDWLEDPTSESAQKYIDLAATYMELDQSLRDQPLVLSQDGFYGVTEDHVQRSDSEPGQTYNWKEQLQS